MTWNKPKNPGVDDVTGEPLTRRSDDCPVSRNTSLMVYLKFIKRRNRKRFPSVWRRMPQPPSRYSSTTTKRVFSGLYLALLVMRSLPSLMLRSSRDSARSILGTPPFCQQSGNAWTFAFKMFSCYFFWLLFPVALVLTGTLVIMNFRG